MSDDTAGQKSQSSFPVLISIAVLVLAISSGVVNYRQNNLANLESMLRDTREKLDLATKELSDTKLRAVIDYVYGESKSSQRFDQQQEKVAMAFADEKEDLVLQLADANDRIKDLEQLAEDISAELDEKSDALDTLKKKKSTAKAKKAKAKAAKAKNIAAKVKKPEATKPEIAQTVKAEAVKKAETLKPEAGKAGVAKPEEPKVELVKTETTIVETAKPEEPLLDTAMVEVNQDINLSPLVGSADVDIYQSGLGLTVRKQADAALRGIGFKPNYPKRPKSMNLSNASTVFFYDKSYESLAGVLAKSLNASIKQTLVIRKGASPYNKNKIIIHLIGK